MSDTVATLKEGFEKMRKEKGAEISDINTYLKRDDIPRWKRDSLTERKNFLKAQDELLQEILKLLDKVKE